VKDIITQALPIALGLGIAGGLALGLFLIANRFFGLFNYASLGPAEVDKVARKFLGGNVVTKADGPDYSRGIINTGGVLYYFKWYYGRSFEFFPTPYERYSGDTDLLGAPHLVLPV